MQLARLVTVTSPEDNGFDRHDGLHGPSESDMERFNREDAEYLHGRKREARTALWKLIAGAIGILFAASMVMNVLLPAISRNPGVPAGPERTPATVTRIFDGRTIAVEVDGLQQTVRYIGVETPEFGDPLYETATAANQQWILGREVLLEADQQDVDSQGRLLRYVWLDDAMINLNLVAVGLSRADTDGSNNRYNDLFTELEDAARARGIGIWQDAEGQRSARILEADATPVHRQT